MIFEAAGDCLLVATQDGDHDHLPGQATQTVTVGAAPLVDPTISAAVGSVTAPRNGWYRSVVRVAFTCTEGSAPLTSPCPAPVFLRADGADQSVSRTVTALDGGTAGVTLAGIDIDRTRPTVEAKGVRPHHTYRHWRVVRCSVSDSLSGPDGCRARTRVVPAPGTHGRVATVRYQLVGADRAGNTRRVHGWYRVAPRHGQHAVPGGPPGWSAWSSRR